MQYRYTLPLLVFAVSSSMAAELPAASRAEIDALLNRLGSSGCQFNRNGSWYSSTDAKAHLASKLDYLIDKKKVEGTEQFIALAASTSSMSGKDYLVKCGTAQAVSGAALVHGKARLFRLMKTTELTENITIEEGNNNPYADLGRPDAGEMLVKAGLAHEITLVIESGGLTQQRAAELLGMPQPKLSDMLRGKFRGIGQAKMIECLNRLGCDVDIVVRKNGQSEPGQTQVVIA